MSYFVYVTFDLKGVRGRADIYEEIKSKLEEIDFSKHILGKKKKDRKLPSNMYIAKFDDESFDRSVVLIRSLDRKIKRIFDESKVHGKYFIAAGKKWAWKQAIF